MLPVIIAAARAYAPWIVFPFAIVVGGVGYMIEGAVSDKHTPWNKSAIGKIYSASICANFLRSGAVIILLSILSLCVYKFISERRQERLLEESNSNSTINSEQTMDESSLKNPDFVPKTVFEKNISPGLLK